MFFQSFALALCCGVYSVNIFQVGFNVSINGSSVAFTKLAGLVSIHPLINLSLNSPLSIFLYNALISLVLNKSLNHCIILAHSHTGLPCI